MEEKTSNLIVADERPHFVAELTSALTTYCSLSPADENEKKILYQAMNSPDHRIADMINMEIEVQDVYCEAIDIVNDETGEVVPSARIVLISPNGESYQAVSMGIYNSIKKAISVFGPPSWATPLKFRVRQISVRGGKGWSTLSLDIV